MTAAVGPFARRLAFSFVGCLLVAGCGDGVPGSSGEPTLSQKIDIAQREQDPVERVHKLLALSAQQRRVKDLPGATTTTEKAEDATGQVQDSVVRTSLLMDVAEEFAVLGRNRQAHDVAGNILLYAAAIPDRNTRLDLERRAAAVLAKVGDTEAAKNAVHNITIKIDDVKEPPVRVELSAIAAAAAFAVGDTPLAEKCVGEIDSFAARITEVPERIQALTVASGRLYRAGYEVEGRKQLDAAVKLARTLTDPAAKAESLLGIFEALEDLRNQVPLAELLPEAKAAAAEVTDEPKRADLTARTQKLLSLPE